MTIIFVLIILHFLIVSLDIAYPLQEILYFKDQKKLDPYTHLTPVGEYVGFFAMNFLDFLSSLGYLYLFFKMGQKQLRESKEPARGEGKDDVEKLRNLMAGKESQAFEPLGQGLEPPSSNIGITILTAEESERQSAVESMYLHASNAHRTRSVSSFMSIKRMILQQDNLFKEFVNDITNV